MPRSLWRINLSDGAQSLLASDPAMATGGLESAGDYLYAGASLPGSTSATLLRRYAKTDGSWTNVAGAGSGYVNGTGSDAWLGSVNDVASDGTNLYVADGGGNNRLRKVLAVPAPTAAGGPVQPGETIGGDNPAELTARCHRCVGKPVDTATGAEFDTTTDLAVPGRGPALSLERTYDSQLAGTPGRFGYGWTDSYAMSLAPDLYRGTAPLASSPVVAVSQENGAATTFARNADGSYSAASRVLATLVRNADGTYTFARRAREKFTFDAAGRLTRQVDLNGYATTLACNTGGQLTTVTEPAGRQLTFSYGPDGHVSQVTDPSRTVSYGYDAAGNLTSVTDSRGGVSSFGYDARHLLTATTDQRGKTTTNTYDAGGRVLTQTDPAGRVLRFAFSLPSAPGTATTTVTDPKGNVTVQNYSNGMLASETKGYGTTKAATWTYTYDPMTDGLASITDPNGHVTAATYDAAGNRLTATDA